MISGAIIRTPLFDASGQLAQEWQKFFLAVANLDPRITDVEALTTFISSLPGASSLNPIYLTDTHANRVASYPSSSYPDGSLFFETDRQYWYVNAFGSWEFLSGLYLTLTANRPADLGTHDVGAMFISTDGNQISRWTGAAWEEFFAETSVGATGGSRLGKNGLWFRWVAGESADDASIQYDGSTVTLTGGPIAGKPVTVRLNLHIGGVVDVNNASYTASKALVTDASKNLVSDANGVAATQTYLKSISVTNSGALPSAAALVTLSDVITFCQNLITALGGAGGTVVKAAAAGTTGTVTTGGGAGGTAGLVTTLS